MIAGGSTMGQLFRVLILGLFLLALSGATPPPPPLQPLPAVPGGVGTALATAAVDEGEHMRFTGLASAIVGSSFNTGTFRSAHPDVDLLFEGTADPLGNRLVYVRVPDSDIDAFVSRAGTLPGVIAGPGKAYVWHVATSDPYWQGQQDAGLSLSDLSKPWQLSTGSGVRIAIVDTGVNEISDLMGKIVAERNLVPGEPPDSAADDSGHGTSVAAVAAARADNAVGIAGVAPDAAIVAVRACYAVANGVAECAQPVLDLALGWVFAEAFNGSIHVVNLSVTGSAPVTPVQAYYLSEIDQLGVAVVVAAGNDGNDTLSGLAASPDVTTVVGTLPDGSPHPLSNSGSEADVAAPYQTYSIDHNNAPVYSEGTSFSAPVISGVLALYRSAVFTDIYLRYDWHRRWRDRSGAGWAPELGYGVPTGDYLYRTMYHFACATFDFDGDRWVDVRDEQLIAWRFNTWWQNPRYDPKYDVEPSYTGDLDIDIKDLQRVFGRDG